MKQTTPAIEHYSVRLLAQEQSSVKFCPLRKGHHYQHESHYAGPSQARLLRFDLLAAQLGFRPALECVVNAPGG